MPYPRPDSTAQYFVRRISFSIPALLLACGTILAAPPEHIPKPRVGIRTLSSVETAPIPTPRPIVLDETWMRAEIPGSEIVPAGNQVVDPPPDLNPDQPKPPAPPAPLGEPDVAPDGAPPMRAGIDPSRPLPPAGAPTQDAPLIDIEFPLSEIFTLRAFEQIGKTKQVVTNRKSFIAILGAPKNDGVLATPADAVSIIGQKLGIVELTLLGETGVRRYRLRITPSVTQIEALIARQFPQSSVEVTAAGEQLLILEGSVETPNEVEGILSLVQEFVGKRGKVINSIKVSGVMQVQLEVVIARVDRSGIRRLGINFEYAGQKAYAGSQVGNIAGITPITSGTANTAAAAGGNAFQNVGGAAGAMITPASTVFVGVTQELQQYMAQIEALQQLGVAKVLAKPTLVTLNGRPAEFLVGGEQPFPYQANAISIPSVEFKKFGTRLNFVPVILGPDKIRLDLVPEVSSVNFTQAINISGNQVPQFITQRIHTTVEMEPGQTLVLGGLLLTESDAQVQKVPVLGDVPGVGVLFRRVRHEERELELIVIVTPRLVHPLDATACPPALPGEESRRPTNKELFLKGMPEAPHDGRDPDGDSYSIKSADDWGVHLNQETPETGAKVKQVSNKSERASRSWMRLPTLNRRQKQGDGK